MRLPCSYIHPKYLTEKEGASIVIMHNIITPHDGATDPDPFMLNLVTGGETIEASRRNCVSDADISLCRPKARRGNLRVSLLVLRGRDFRR